MRQISQTDDFPLEAYFFHSIQLFNEPPNHLLNI